ncbi:MAG: hypothetical protein WC354_07115 [Candidatus Omnitrophota bacterium]|jgi:hypothetical protein
MSKIQISKIDAAKRQLDTAINLFFNDADPVSIHTLTSAAYDILVSLAKSQGIPGIIKNSSMIKKEHEKEYLDIINKPQNFFKHSGKDPKKTLEFSPKSTTFVLWDAVRIYMELTDEKPSNMIVYRNWFFLEHPNYLNDNWKIIYETQRTITNPSDKAKFLEIIHLLDDIKYK